MQTLATYSQLNNKLLLNFPFSQKDYIFCCGFLSIDAQRDFSYKKRSNKNNNPLK